MFTSRPVPLTASRPLHTKTPGRALQNARGILQENALHGPRTVKTLRVQVQTPSKGGSPKSPKKLSKDTQLSKTAGNSVARPLGDKTPFANRQRRVVNGPTPCPTKLNPPALDERLELLTPGHVLLPSSARKSVRGRRSSGPLFETPVPSGNHWDVIEEDAIAPVVPEVQSEEVQQEDYDEVEYMPPTAIDPPYTPHFDVPDYKLMGIRLFDMMHSIPNDDATDRFYAAEKESIDDTGLLEASGFNASPSQWDFFGLPEDDDPSPFLGLRSVGEASKRSTKAAQTTQRTGHMAKGIRGTASVARARAATIPKPQPFKQPALPNASKPRQAVRRDATPMAVQTKKSPQNNPPPRPATAAGRMASTLRSAPASAPRILARPATSASLRPPTGTTRTAKLRTNMQTGITPLVADPVIGFQFEDTDVRDNDFMFNI